MKPANIDETMPEFSNSSAPTNDMYATRTKMMHSMCGMRCDCLPMPMTRKVSAAQAPMVQPTAAEPTPVITKAKEIDSISSNVLMP